LFDISFIKKITLLQVIKNIQNLFNGKITSHKLVKNYKTSELKVNIIDSQTTYIQADGELIDSSNFIVSILPSTLSFIIPSPNS